MNDAAARQLTIMREFLQRLAKDPWIGGRLGVAARDALKHWDDPLYHGQEHERSVAFQEAGYDAGEGE